MGDRMGKSKEEFNKENSMNDKNNEKVNCKEKTENIKDKNEGNIKNKKCKTKKNRKEDTKLTKVLKLLLLLCICIIVGMIIFDLHSAHIVNDSLTDVTTELDKIILENQRKENEKEEKKEIIDENNNNEIQPPTSSRNVSTPKKMSVNIGNSKVHGKVKISKIGIEYPIIEYVDDNSLWKSICKISNNPINGTGNLCLAGHNMRNLTMFAKLKWLEKGDEVEITNIYGDVYKYIIYDKFYVDPDDVDVIKNTVDPIITLITCNNSSSKRLIVKAKLQQ